LPTALQEEEEKKKKEKKRGPVRVCESRLLEDRPSLGHIRRS
jgi:hypothetical protein